jgi:hypothetical protein
MSGAGNIADESYTAPRTMRAVRAANNDDQDGSSFHKAVSSTRTNPKRTIRRCSRSTKTNWGW